MNWEGTFFWVVAILGLIWLFILIYSLVNLYKRNDKSLISKIIWAFVIISAPVLGLVLYLVLGNKI